MRIDELAVALDVDLKSLVPVPKVLRLDEHIEADGRGSVRGSPVMGDGAGALPSSAPMRAMTRSRAGRSERRVGCLPPSSAVSP